MFRRILIALAVTCVATSAVAQPEPYRESRNGQTAACLRQRNIRDFKIVPGNRSLVIIDSSRQRFRLNFLGQCDNLEFQFGLEIRSRGIGTLSCIAQGDSVLLHEPVGPNVCAVRNVEYQTPMLDRKDMEAARALKR